jgi:hypothetical protein
MKSTATAVVTLPSRVGVPIEPNTAWLPPPPKADPMSAPLPAWRRTSPMMIRLTRICAMTRRTKNITCYSFGAPPLAADFLAIAMKLCAWRLAPPTRKPSTSGSSVIAPALSAFTLPP